MVIMVWLTRNSASAQHVASADQFNALLQRPLPKLRITLATVHIKRYNRIHWQRSCPGKAAAGGCPSAPGSGARPQPVLAPARGAGAAQPMLWQLPKRAGKPEARSKAQTWRRRPKQSKTLKLEVQNSPRTSIEARSASRGPKQVWKPEARIEAWSARRSRKRSSK